MACRYPGRRVRLSFGFRRATRTRHTDARVPEGLRVFAIGDIHGRDDLLDTMAELIATDLRDRPVADALVVCLGDAIDRGHGSARVLDRLARRDLPAPLVALMGNHEALLDRFLTGQLAADSFYRNGGDATLVAYGLDPATMLRLPHGEAGARLRDAMPPAHLAFLDSARLSHTVGDYFFCHAGVRPGVTLERQNPEDLLWIREEFLRSSADFGRIVVHGHTPGETPEVRRNRINVDTGAWMTGVLTAVVLEGAERRFLQTQGRAYG